MALAEQRLAKAADEGWVKMFDGKSLRGWRALSNPGAWSVQDGLLVGHDVTANSLLFFIGDEVLGGPTVPPSRFRVRDFELEADVMLRPGGVSSLYFRAAFGPSGPGDVGVAPGYIAQANNTALEIPARTGSLYSLDNIYDQLVADDTWWTQRVVAIGDRIQIFVNGERVVDFVDRKNRYREGYLALLVLGEYAPTTVFFRNVMMRHIPDGSTPARR